ncbi:F0F1 ATP synthase subunit gamma [Oceanibaculum nanhaiense]|jgi:F-type H+-transporting ATPase subunit gamma|uniref:F0F1 ATP synthase subunit gamma n=1 Tax=Oceanibaculum nanhaiense TaxID=1909734 RepID=UPI000A3C7EEF|nr:F0F1 ATP synthase subunit gamma [Oceanibaculum nanhaiense]MBC7134980.1 F0F1 ATP synthase subunit gamma [Oceanibaculum nanhaiense]MDM7947201.1 F0F1 ATP synthase subunit gamma [Oceanibaculum nanhaiense]
MPSLKDLRNRIKSVQSTRKITSAMKMVAAAKLRRAQEQAEAARPYAERMERMLASVAGRLQGATGAPKLVAGTGKDDVQLVVVATADRGLCGGFNTNIVRAARIHIRKLLADGKTVKILCVGRKGRDVLRREFRDKIVDLISFAGQKRLAFSDADGIAVRLLEMYEAGEFDVATIFYARFKSAISQIPTGQQLIPVALPEAGEEKTENASQALYEYEPDEEQILAALLPRNLAVQIYKTLLENAAGEQGARMSAMDSATRNAGEMIDKLSLTYNRQRQANITKELIEIISGAEAL